MRANTIVSLTSREFNQHASEAKKTANLGPVFITDRGRPAHVLLSMADYQRLLGTPSKIGDLLAMPIGADIAFEPLPLHGLPQAADLS